MLSLWDVIGDKRRNSNAEVHHLPFLKFHGYSLCYALSDELFIKFW